MRIADVKAHAIQAQRRNPRPWRQGLEVTPVIDYAFLRIIADDGTEGHSLWNMHGHVMVDLVQSAFKPELVGEDPLCRERIWQRLYDLDRIRAFPYYAIGLVDIAVWDLVGKSLGLPLYKLLGAYRERTPAYASTYVLDTVEDYVGLCQDAHARGYRGAKLHLWGDVERDIAACRTISAAAPEGFLLMFDAAGAYNFEEALRMGRCLESLGFAWFEEPVRDSEALSLRKLTQTLDIPIVAAENTPGHVYDAANQILSGACDVLHVDAIHKAGVTGFTKIAHLTEGFGITCGSHLPGIVQLHLCCAFRNVPYYESLYPEETPIPGLVRPSVIRPDPDGYVRPPEIPGLGMEIDWRWVHENTVIEV